MTKRKADITVTVILSLLLIGLVIGYHHLQINDYFSRNIHDWILKMYEKDVPVYSILFSKKTQYIILTVTYVMLFHFINIMINSKGTKYVLAVLGGIVFAAHIFIADTLINFRSFDYRFHKYTSMNLREFSISGMWGHSISKYGFGIIIINAAFMISLLVLMVKVRSYRTKPDRYDFVDILWPDDPDDDGFKDYFKAKSSEELKDKISPDEISSFAKQVHKVENIINLYMNDCIGYRGVLEYVESLEPGKMDDCMNLWLLNQTIGGKNPVIRSAVKRATVEKYRDQMPIVDSEMKKLLDEDSEKDDSDKHPKTKDGKVIKVDFNK